jgi:hypothetical protein
MTIAAAVAAMWLAATIGNWRSRLRAPFVVAVVAAMVVPAAASGLPFVGAQMQGGALDAIHRICRETGPDAAIAVEPYALLETELPQTLRGFCGVPSASLEAGHLIRLTTVARAWKNQGRQFYVVSAAQRPVQAAAPSAVEVAHLVIADAREPDRTLGRRPRHYAPRRVDLWLYRVDPA